MNLNIKKISDVTFEVSGKVDEPELKNIYEQELEKIRQNIKIPGFRPGKAPKDIVEARYGEEIKANTVKRKIAEILESESQKKEKWLMITEIRELVWKEEKEGISFTVKVEAIPRKKIDLDVNIDKIDDIELSDDEIKREIEIARERFAIAEDIDKQELGGEDLGVFDITIKDIKTGRTTLKEKDRLLDMARVEEWFKNIALGMKKGETKEAMTYINGDKKVTITLKAIKKKVLPSDDDLAKTLGYKDENEMKDELRKKIEQTKKEIAKERKYIEFMSKVAEKNKLQIPKALIAENFQKIMQRNPRMKREDAENLAIFQSAESIILLNVSEDMKIEVSENDVQEYIKRISAENNTPYERMREIVDKSREKVEEYIKIEKAKQKLLEIID